MTRKQPAIPRVIILGGGFGGLHAARALRRAPARVTLVDRRNFHLFQPLLYQVAVGGLSPANIAAPLRSVLRRQKNVAVLLGEVVDVDAAARHVVLADGSALAYDALIVATGGRHNYFGHPEWESVAPGLKTVEDATSIRARVLSAFETAERLGPAEADEWLTFVVVGGGPTGVELAGALAEVARHTLRRDFRHIDPARARVVLVEGAERVLPTFAPDLSDKALASLQRLNVEVRTRTMVTQVDETGVCVRTGEEEARVRARTVLWAAGVSVSPLAEVLERRTDAARDRVGRVMVEPDLSIAGHPEVFVIGDMAHVRGADGKPLPGVAPVAMQEGRYVARVLLDRRKGKSTEPFRYRDRGSMATIGRAAAVVDLGFVRFSGWFAWVLWLFLHLMYLVQFQNRVLVFIQWAWNYFTWNRSARLITETATNAAKAGD